MVCNSIVVTFCYFAARVEEVASGVAFYYSITYKYHHENGNNVLS